MKIGYLNGARLKRAIIAGSEFVVRARDHLNEINVFPVADADTGTNMASTLESIAEATRNCNDMSIEVVGNVIAESALNGARGNSGAILAQFFQGLTDELKGKLRITTRHFGQAVMTAAERARDALSTPRDGTIITVMKDWAVHVHRHSHEKRDFVELLKGSLREAKRSLAETPKKLEILSKAGVVDAGAEGFVKMIEGVVHFIESGRTRGELMRHHIVEKLKKTAIFHEPVEDIKFRYCTECIIERPSIERKLLQKKLTNYGDSLIVAGGTKKIRVHLHTNTPEIVLEYLGTVGNVTNRKIDDMKQQHIDHFVRTEKKAVALVTDSSCDLPQEFITKHKIHVVPLSLRFGSEAYLDKIEMSPEEFYRRFEMESVNPTTSQPSPADFLKVFNRAEEKFSSIISIHISGVLSGTLQAAKTAAQKIKNTRMTVIDGKNTSIGLGLIMREAAQAVAAGLDHDQVVDRIKKAIKNVRIFVAVPTLKYLVRSGRVSALKGVVANAFNLKPIISLNSEGAATNIDKTFGGKGAHKKIIRLAETYARQFAKPVIGVVHSNAPEKGRWVAAQLEMKFGLENIWLLNAAPVLGVHVGPGAVAISVLGK